MSLRLPEPPRAEILSVGTLIREVLAGKIRIPEFQRAFQWDGVQIRLLLDSVFRGFPIGSLLMWKGERPAETFHVGPVTVVAPARHDAWAVVDGQQRLTTLVGTLARTEAAADPGDRFAIWLDPAAISEDELFRPAPRNEGIPDRWVPVSVLHDSAVLMDWLLERPVFQEQKALRQAVIEVGKRLREYAMPVYVVESEEQTIPREIFTRVNRQGTTMEEADVFNALAGKTSRHPGRLEDLQDVARTLGVGEIARHKLLQCVMAVRGLDVTRRLNDQGGRRLTPQELASALEDTAPALRSTLAFLRTDAAIPHLRLLPYPVPLIVLTRFFRYFPDPGARSRQLLVRWVWRGLLSGAHQHGDRRQLRGAVEAIVAGHEEESVQRVLHLVPRVAPDRPWWLETHFDGRSATSRIAGLGMASLAPRHLEEGQSLDVTALVGATGSDAFRPLYPRGGSLPGNRILHPAGDLRAALARLAQRQSPENDAVLASHGIRGEAVAAIVRRDWAAAIAARQEQIGRVVSRLGAIRAAWGRGDRKSIDALLADSPEGPPA